MSTSNLPTAITIEGAAFRAHRREAELLLRAGAILNAVQSASRHVMRPVTTAEDRCDQLHAWIEIGSHLTKCYIVFTKRFDGLAWDLVAEGAPKSEPFTANILPRGMVQIGSMFDYGVTDKIQMGTDLLATIIGAPTFHIKGEVYRSEENAFALGLREGFLSKQTLFWGGTANEFEELSARIIRPSVSWSHVFHACGC